MSTVRQIHLIGAKGKLVGYSGRGVRMRDLDAAEKDLASRIAAKAAGPDATNGEFMSRRTSECLCRSIVAVTKEGKLSAEGVMAATWMSTTQEALEDTGGPLSFAKLFTAKDRDAMAHFFRLHHDAEEADVEAIMGKEIELTDG